MVDKKGCSVWLAPGLLGSASPLVAPSGERTLAADHHSSQSHPSGRPAGSIIPLLPVAVLRAVPRNSPYRREQKAFVVGAVDVLHVRRVQLMACAVTAHGLLAKPAFFYEQRGPCRCHEVVRYAAHDKCTYSFAHVDSPSEEGRSRQPFNAAGLSAVPRRCSHAGPELYRNASAVLLFSLLLRWPAYKACVTINQKTAAQNRFDTLNRIGIHSKEWRYSTSIEVVRGKNRLTAAGLFLAQGICSFNQQSRNRFLSAPRQASHNIHLHIYISFTRRRPIGDGKSNYSSSPFASEAVSALPFG